MTKICCDRYFSIAMRMDCSISLQPLTYNESRSVYKVVPIKIYLDNKWCD